jgi:hypothetical protein
MSTVGVFVLPKPNMIKLPQKTGGAESAGTIHLGCCQLLTSVAMLTNIVGGVFRYPAHETETPINLFALELI